MPSQNEMRQVSMELFGLSHPRTDDYVGIGMPDGKLTLLTLGGYGPQAEICWMLHYMRVAWELPRQFGKPEMTHTELNLIEWSRFNPHKHYYIRIGY